MELKVDVGLCRLCRRRRRCVVGRRCRRHRGLQLDRGQTEPLGVSRKVGVAIVPKGISVIRIRGITIPAPGQGLEIELDSFWDLGQLWFESGSRKKWGLEVL